MLKILLFYQICKWALTDETQWEEEVNIDFNKVEESRQQLRMCNSILILMREALSLGDRSPLNTLYRRVLQGIITYGIDMPRQLRTVLDFSIFERCASYQTRHTHHDHYACVGVVERGVYLVRLREGGHGGEGESWEMLGLVPGYSLRDLVWVKGICDREREVVYMWFVNGEMTRFVRTESGRKLVYRDVKATLLQGCFFNFGMESVIARPGGGQDLRTIRFD